MPLGVLRGAAASSGWLTLPFAAAAHGVDRDYGLSRQGWGGWLGDQLESLGVVVGGRDVAGAPRRGAGRAALARGGGSPGRARPRSCSGFAGSFLYPVLVEPLFNRFTPMPDGPLQSSILRLADREGVHVDDVLVADASRRTTTLNAYVAGSAAPAAWWSTTTC